MIKKDMVWKEGVVDIVCDMCGRSTKGNHNFEYAILSAEWGYDSYRDTMADPSQRVESHLCDKCCFEIEEYIKRRRKEKDANRQNVQNKVPFL